MRPPTTTALLAALASLALGCATTSGAVEGAAGEDAAGGRLYREHCGSCHRLRDPTEQTTERWAWAVDRFGPRAHLSPEQRRLVLGWLQARAKDAPAATAAKEKP
jgi:mono/diheme cytochrome c family protein